MSLKSAYELAQERIIASRAVKPEPKPIMDFISIPEFDNREDKVIEQDGSNHTKSLEDMKKENERKSQMNNIRIQQPEKISFDELMEVYWQGNFLDFGGFARMNRTMVFGLSNRNVKVKIEIEPYLDHINQSTKDQLNELVNTDISSDATKVFGVTVPTGIGYAGKKILYTMIETSEKVHNDYAGKLDLMNEIWVASEYGKKMLVRSNVHTPIRVMPLGVDVARYKPNCGKMDFGTATKEFKFLSVFRWSYRKGFDILLRAFLDEFSNEDDVSLVMVSRAVDRPEQDGLHCILNDFNDIKGFVHKPENEMPHVALYTKPIAEKDMPKVYGSCNAFVLISRGEGFCLPIIEAASCGLPVIASNVTAQTDYLKEDNSYLIEPEGFVEAKINGSLARMAKLCHFYEGQMFPHFDLESIDKTKEYMRFVYNNYSEAKKKADKLRNSIVNGYTWDMAVDRVYKRLRELQ